MKAMFGVVSLLIALAVVGMLAARQLTAVAPSVAPAASAAGTSIVIDGGATVREQSQQLQRQVADDVKRALEQGAASRGEPAEQ